MPSPSCSLSILIVDSTSLFFTVFAWKCRCNCCVSTYNPTHQNASSTNNAINSSMSILAALRVLL